MENYTVKKHWFFWVPYIVWSLIFITSIFLPIIIIIYAFMRWKTDKLEIKNNCLFMQRGIIHIDKKTIPLEQISFISEKTNLIAHWFGCSAIEIQSSAFAKEIIYPFVADSNEFINFFNSIRK